MLKYIGVRLIEAAPVALAMTVLAFLIIHVVPGDPVRLALGPHATEGEIATRRHDLGLDQALPTQYLDFLRSALDFDFGISIRADEPVSRLIWHGVWPTMLLVGLALFLSAILAIGLGIVSAAYRGRLVDQTIRAISTITFVTPVFWMALLMVTVVSIKWGLLPTSGFGESLATQVRSVLLPALALALTLAPVLLRLLRSGVIETMQTAYIEGARSRRVPLRRLLMKHALRPSVGGTLNVWGYLFAVTLSSAVVVEKIFGIPGIGSLLVDSVAGRDFPVIQALTLLMGLAVVVGTLGIDILHALVDPRIRV